MVPQELSLEQTLQLACQNPTMIHYALALGKSRNEAPTPTSLELTLQLMESEGDRWQQVLQRQASRNYPMVFDIANERKVAWSVLAGMAHPVGNLLELKVLSVKIVNELSAGSQTVWRAVTVLIKTSLQIKQPQFIADLLRRIIALVQSNKLGPLLQTFGLWQITNAQQDVTQLSITTFFEVQIAIIKLYRKCLSANLKYGHFMLFSKEQLALLDWFKQIFTHATGYIQRYNGGQATRRVLLKHKLIAHSFQLLQQLSQVQQLQLFWVDTCALVVSLLMRVGVLRNQQTQMEDQLNFEYGLMNREFGEDLESVVAQTIIAITHNVPIVLREILLAIRRVIQQNAIAKDERALSEGLLRLGLLHRLVLTREDLVLQIVGVLFQTLFSERNSIQSVSTNCRKLRLLLFYGDILTDNHFKYLITTAMQILKNESCSSFAFFQADNIFERMIEVCSSGEDTLPRFARLIKENVAATGLALVQIVEATRNQQSADRDEKSMRLVKLLRGLMERNQQEAQLLALKIVQSGAGWLTEEVVLVWAKAEKHSPLVYELVQLLRAGIQLLEQNYYLDVNQQLYRALWLLKNPQLLHIVDELLDILEMAIKLEGGMNGQLCQIVATAFQTVVAYEKGNLYSMANIIKVLNQKNIAEQVMFEWGDLVRNLAALYLNYFQDFANKLYTDLYRSQYQEVAAHFQSYLQAYEYYIEDNADLRASLLHGIRAMADGEWRCRFFLVLHHQSDTPGFDFFTLKQAAQCSRRGTMRLTFFYYTDKLVRNYSEIALDQFLQFNKIFDEKKKRRALQADLLNNTPFPEVQLKTYVYEGFKHLHQKKCIDLADYHMLIREFRLQ